MIDLYTWTTPNGRKVTIMLEELGLPYEVHAIDIGKGAQMAPEFLKISPNNKIPAIVDRDTGTSLMESAAIMLYLGKKTGKFVPSDDAGYWRMMEWLMMQMGSVGPMFGQVHHFTKYNPGKAPYAQERYETECRRIYGVLDKRLGEAPYLAGDDYTIADIATWPWIARHDWQEVDLNDYPNARRWYVEIAERPATRRGWNVPPTTQEIPMPA